MFSVAIVDDCSQDGIRLEKLLDAYCTRHPLRIKTQLFTDSHSFFAAREEAPFQLVFLDIFLSEENGMDVARRIRETDSRCLIVFISSSPAFAVESYRVRAHDYLLKPFQTDAFEQVMTLCDATLRRQSLFLEVKEGRLYRRIPLEAILYTDYCNHYIQIHLMDETVKTYMPFQQFSELLAAHPRFICCYRNMMLNLDWVDRMDEKDFVLKNGRRVPIARKNHREIRQQYTDYAFDHPIGGVKF